MQVNQLISAGNAGADYTSVAVQKGDIQDYSIQIVFSSATLNGTLTVECSNDNTNFVTVGGSSQSISSGVGHMYNLNDQNYKWFRLKWTYTSGTGTLTSVYALVEPLVRG